MAGGEETTDAIEGMCDGAEGRSDTSGLNLSHSFHNSLTNTQKQHARATITCLIGMLFPFREVCL